MPAIALLVNNVYSLLNHKLRSIPVKPSSRNPQVGLQLFKALILIMYKLRNYIMIGSAMTTMMRVFGIIFVSDMQQVLKILQEHCGKTNTKHPGYDRYSAI